MRHKEIVELYGVNGIYLAIQPSVLTTFLRGLHIQIIALPSREQVTILSRVRLGITASMI